MSDETHKLGQPDGTDFLPNSGRQIADPPAHLERPDYFKRILDLATLLVIIVGLYFAWDQAKKLTESITANNNAMNLTTMFNITNTTSAIDKYFIDDPELWKYFFQRVDITHYPYPGSTGSLNVLGGRLASG